MTNADNGWKNKMSSQEHIQKHWTVRRLLKCYGYFSVILAVTWLYIRLLFMVISNALIDIIH